MNKKALLFILIAVILVASAVYLEQHPSQSSAVGIIGGADGPTSIFVTSSMAPISVGIVALAAVTLLSCLAFLLIRRK